MNARDHRAALVALDHPRDAAIDIALPQTVNALESLWRPLLEANKLKFDKESHRDFAEREAGIGFDQRLGSYLKKKSPGLDETRAITGRLVTDANIKQARMVVDDIARKGPDANPEIVLTLLDGLAKVGQRGDFSLGQRISPLKKLLGHPNDEVAAAAVANLGVWQLKGSDPDLFRILRDDARAGSVRRAAAVWAEVAARRQWGVGAADVVELQGGGVPRPGLNCPGGGQTKPAKPVTNP